jgi:hypothetical protein
MTYTPQRDSANVNVFATTNTTLTNWGRSVYADATSGNLTVELATAIGNDGEEVEVIKRDSTANTVTIVGAISVPAIPLASVTTVGASVVVTSVGLFTAPMVGREITGPGIPPLSTVATFVDANTITISAPAGVGFGVGAGNIVSIRETVNGKKNLVIEVQNTAYSMRSDGTNAVVFDDAGLEIRPGFKVVSSNYTMLPTDEVILVDAALGPITITLPLTAVVATASRTKSAKFKKIDVTPNAITIATSGVATIEKIDSFPMIYGATTMIDVPGQAQEFFANQVSNRWHIGP